MIEWNHAAKLKWGFSLKNEGKNMKDGLIKNMGRSS